MGGENGTSLKLTAFAHLKNGSLETTSFLVPVTFHGLLLLILERVI